MLEYMQRGGPLMWLILFCSIVAGAVFLERWSYYHRITIRVGEFLRGIANLINRRNYAEALHECAGTPGPVARVVHAALIRRDVSRTELREIVEEAGQLEVPSLERNLTILVTIAFIAPLIGLLGTVTGLIEAFVAISNHSGFATSAEISTGIYHSLLTTAAGLVVSIPSAVGFSFLSARVNTIIHDMERCGIEIVNLLMDRRAENDAGIIEFSESAKTKNERNR